MKTETTEPGKGTPVDPKKGPADPAKANTSSKVTTSLVLPLSRMHRPTKASNAHAENPAREKSACAGGTGTHRVSLGSPVVRLKPGHWSR